MKKDQPTYRGRFAPSPTGDLHLGSLSTALASFLDARHHCGAWHIRIDNLDPPREVKGSFESIHKALLQHGLEWDGTIYFQGSNTDKYKEALNKLWEKGHIFRCTCTRSLLAKNGSCQTDCYLFDRSETKKHSLRINLSPGETNGFDDLILGWQSYELDNKPHNFIVRRRDGLFAYQLAAAVDDSKSKFSHIIRGSDLLASTHRQRRLRQILGLESPKYGHIPLRTDEQGIKLSKHTGAAALDPRYVEQNLRSSLAHLGQPNPPNSAKMPGDILNFAVENWSRTHIIGSSCA